MSIRHPWKCRARHADTQHQAKRGAGRAGAPRRAFQGGRLRSTLLSLALVSLLAAGCKEAGATVEEPPGNHGDGGVTPSITLLISPSSLSLTQGDQGTIAVALTRSTGFTSDIVLTAEGLPTGVTATFAPATVPSAGSASTLSLAVGGSATPGTYTVTVRASAEGATAKSTAFSLTVTAVTTPGYTMQVQPTSLTMQQGGSANATISVTRFGGFASSVNLRTSTLPAGINANITPPVAVDVPPTLTVGATFNATVGSYTFDVIASATGVPDHTVTINVQVTSSNPVGEVAYTFCSVTGQPLWFVYQDGTGGWQRITGINSVYAFDLNASKGGVAYALPTAGSGYAITVFWGTEGELKSNGASLCAGSASTRTLGGSVANVGAAEQAWLQLPGTTVTILPAVSTAFQVSNVLEGPFDLLASRIAIGQGGVLTLDRLLFRRGINPANGSTLSALDFGGSEAFAPEGHSLLFSNLGSDQTRIVTSYWSAGRVSGAYFADGFAIGGTTRTWAAVPASRQNANDLHMINVIATPPGGGTPTETRGATLMMRSAIDRSITFGPALGALTLTTPAATPYVRFRVQYPLQAAYNTYWAFSAAQPSSNRSITMSATASWFGTVAVVDLAVPDFNGIQGFDANWGLRPGVQTTWTFSASGWLAAGGGNHVPFTDGTLALSATRTGQITP
jgi:hypothetical protein